MFSKVEIAGIALSVTAMAAALYLVTKDDTSLAVSRTSQTAEVGRIFVSEDGDQANNLRNAIVGAADSTGNLSKLIVDDVIFGTGDEVKVGDTVRIVEMRVNLKLSIVLAAMLNRTTGSPLIPLARPRRRYWSH